MDMIAIRHRGIGLERVLVDLQLLLFPVDVDCDAVRLAIRRR